MRRRNVSMLAGGLLIGLLMPASAGVPPKMNYQGILRDGVTGKPVSDSSYVVTVRIYDFPTGGTMLWEETDTLQTVAGLFTIILGQHTPLPAAGFDGSTRYLGVQPNGQGEMFPRVALVSVPYALDANRLNGKDETDFASSTHTHTVTTNEIVNGTVRFEDIGQNGAAVDQVIKWSGSAWIASDLPAPSDNSVAQIKLKTSSGEVSTNSYASDQLFTLPGGEYGFYPQIRGASSASGRHSATILGTAGMDPQVPPTSYTTNISLRAENTTIYARQRYVTSSGKDHWIFLLVDKNTKQIVAGYQAPDHPCCGSSGDEHDIPHPFLSFDRGRCQVVLVDNSILPELKSQVTSRKSLLEVVMEDYEVDLQSRPQYRPREIVEIDEYGDKPGEILRRIPTPYWAKFLIERDEIFLRRRLVTTLPVDVLYCELKPKSGVLAVHVSANRRGDVAALPTSVE